MSKEVILKAPPVLNSVVVCTGEVESGAEAGG